MARRRGVYALASVMAVFGGHAQAQSLQALQSLSIVQLGQIKVTSVLKSPQLLSDAPAAIYVITHDEIIDSGATTIPEMLRLAPNLEVVQINATDYAITARGFNVGDNASLSNKLLVLIDGRSVYSPMFGGVYWDMLDLPPADIERIEVISGPGGTLWGSNAVNGVINIITRPSARTQGGLVTLGVGNDERNFGLQYGGRLSPDLTYRVNGAFESFNSYPEPGGKSAEDSWARPDGGFRLDWTPRDDSVSVQGDLITETEEPYGYNRETDLAASWHHQFGNGASLQLLAYYDDAARTTDGGGPAFWLNTYDVELQNNFTLAGWNDIVWGAGERAYRYVFENTALALIPSSQTLSLADIFGQDTISLSPALKLTIGVKLEDEPYAGAQAMPNVRLAWKFSDNALLWGAISRAVRSPTPVDTNLNEFVGPVDFLAGSTGFHPETLTAYELGTRIQATTNASFSISTYYDAYDDLRTIDPGTAAAPLPLRFGNLMTGDVYGVELWGDFQVTDWWRLSPGFDALHESLRFLSGSLSAVGLAFTADDPGQQASLNSIMNFGHGLTWDADLREVAKLPHPGVPGYTELDTSLGWAINDTWRVSLTGDNLLHASHQEFLEDGESTEVPRSVFAQATMRF
jgi:iron complex outermembrane receptor protein